MEVANLETVMTFDRKHEQQVYNEQKCIFLFVWQQTQMFKIVAKLKMNLKNECILEFWKFLK